MKKIISILILALLLLGCAMQGQQQGQLQQQNKTNKIKVVASFYPIWEFAKNVGGERAEVSMLMPPGVSPHEFEPTPSAIKQLNEADIFIINGAGLESWAPNLIQGVSSQKLVVVDSSKGIKLIESQDPDAQGSDPHIWLAPPLAKMQVENIKEAFIKADPAGSEYYKENAMKYKAKLDELDKKIRETFSTCKKKDILIAHATLGYFCKEYNCNQIPIEGINEEGEPTPAELALIVRQAQEKNVSAVYFENLISPKSAKALADEINGKVLVFNTVHGLNSTEEALGENYITLMEKNIDAIRQGLDCK